MKVQKSKHPLLIDGENLTLQSIEKISRGREIRIEDSRSKEVEKSRALVKIVAKGKEAFYGINTGFGYLATKKVSPAKTKALQLNLVKSHAGGYGEPLSLKETRVAMTLKLHTLLKGFSGVRFELCRALYKLIKHEIYPIIPEYGSVGASGDLAPLAHLALPLIGEGDVHYCGKVIKGSSALKKCRLSPLSLYEKEGLALVNGTQIMSAVGALALIEAHKVLERADKITALSFEALESRIDALHPLLHQARGQIGQICSAERILSQLEGSYLYTVNTPENKVQDSYSIRCAPQVHGPSIDAINYCSEKIEMEINGATDNPLVFAQQEKILSGGNFHGQSLALPFDFSAIALSEIGNISERRLELLLNPHFNKLTPFLTPDPGIQSGYMILQYLSASLVNENKVLASPASTDSIPGNVGIEDHVSMGMTGARKLKKIVENIKVILAIELLAASQAVDLKKISQLGKGTEKIYHKLRKKVPKLSKDRIISDDVEKAVKVFEKI